MLRKHKIYLTAGGCLASLVAIVLLFSHKETTDNEHHVPRDYPEIVESGILRAVTEYNAISYHASGDTVEGFDYDLLHAFADEKKLRLVMIPEMSFEKRLDGICSGAYDILATGTAITSQSKDSLLFTRHILLGKQVLVQRKKENENDSLYINNLLELGHKNLHVVGNSPALLRIHNLINEIADTIYIQEVKDYGPEQLLAMVSGGDIDYAVCDENIAQVSLPQFTNLDISKDISFTQFYAWGVNKRSTILLDSLNSWLERYVMTDEYKKLYKKYFN